VWSANASQIQADRRVPNIWPKPHRRSDSDVNLLRVMALVKDFDDHSIVKAWGYALDVD